MQRRTFLRGSALGVLAATVGPWVRVPSLGPGLARADEGSLLPLTSRPANYESVRETFTARITPLERFYIRSHFDLPALDPATWRLKLGGLAGRPQSLSLADLERMPQTTVEAALQCAGNGRGLFRPTVPGVQWRWGAMGNAEWTGVRFKDLLALSAPGSDARWVQLQGADRPTLQQTPSFVRGIPVDKAMHPDTLVALRMNGRPLSEQHGAPARLVVPGWVGDDWVKWLSDVVLRSDEPKGFFYETGYRFPDQPGAPGQPVPPAQTRPMTELNVKSIIGSISPGQVLARGRVELVGVAVAGTAGVAKVEVSVDGGRRWRAAALEGPRSAWGFRVFRFPWRVEAPGVYRIAARATDGSGAVQPVEPVWNPSGYLHNAIDVVTVEVRA